MKNYKIEPYSVETEKQRYYKEEAYLRAQKKVKKLIGFYWHLASYVIVNLFIIAVIVMSGGDLWSFGTFSTAIFWGIGLVFHALGVFGPDIFFGSNWEERKIKELMEKDEQNWQ